MDLFRGLLKCPRDTAADVLQNKCSRRGSKRTFQFFLWPSLASHTIILALVSATQPQCQTLFFFLSAATFCQGPYLNFRLWLCPESQVPTGKRILQILRDSSLFPLGLSSLAWFQLHLYHVSMLQCGGLKHHQIGGNLTLLFMSFWSNSST